MNRRLYGVIFWCFWITVCAGKYCPYSVLEGVTFEALCEYGGVRVPCDPKGIRPGTIATVHCQAGYRKQEGCRHNTLVCGEEGEWDHQPTPCIPVCGTEPRMAMPLSYGGKSAGISLAPWHVAIYDLNKNGTYSYMCGGTIINARVIISAAHCFWDSNLNGTADKSRFAVGAGKFYRDYDALEKGNPQFFNLSELHVPETYRHLDGFFQDDIAVLVVENHIKFGLNIKPICIEWQSYHDKAIKSDVIGRVARWEIQNITELRIIDMTSLSYAECLDKAEPDYKNFVTGDKFCVTVRANEPVCVGSSGSGFVVPKQIGGQKVHFFWGLISTAITSKVECSGEFLLGFTNIQYHAAMITDYEIRFRAK